MANQPLFLDLSKRNQTNPIIYGRVADEDMQTVTVNVTNRDEKIDLTGFVITFEGVTEANTKVFDTSGISTTITDLQKGTFNYTFPNVTFSTAGTYKRAYFSFVKDGKRDSTDNFDLVVLKNADIDASEAETIITEYNQLVAELNQIYDKTTTELNASYLAMKKQLDELANKLATMDVYSKQETRDCVTQTLDSLKLSERNLFRGFPNNEKLRVEKTGYYYQYPFKTKGYYIPFKPNTEYILTWSVQTFSGDIGDMSVGYSNDSSEFVMDLKRIDANVGVLMFKTPAVLPHPYFGLRMSRTNTQSNSTADYWDLVLREGNKSLGWDRALEDSASKDTIENIANGYRFADKSSGRIATNIHAKDLADVTVPSHDWEYINLTVNQPPGTSTSGFVKRVKASEVIMEVHYRPYNSATTYINHRLNNATTWNGWKKTVQEGDAPSRAEYNDLYDKVQKIITKIGGI